MNVEQIAEAVRAGDLSTRGLVRITHALAERGKNTTSALGQYGEELVAAACGGTVVAFDQRGYDVLTAKGERLQVKTYTVGRRAGVIRSFAYDVVTVAVSRGRPPWLMPAATGRPICMPRSPRSRPIKYRHLNAGFAAWGGQPGDRFERGWTIGSGVTRDDVTALVAAAGG